MATTSKRRNKKTPSEARSARSGDDYVIMSVKRACDVLNCFDSERELLRLDEITTRTQLPRPTAFRLLCTLVACGMLEKREKNVYARASRRNPGKLTALGMRERASSSLFTPRIWRVRRCAYKAGVELVLLDNQYSASKALRNAQRFVDEKVDLVIEFQAHMEAASQVASIVCGAGIPLIPIEIPHPGAYFYGANNYKAGSIGGHYLAQSCLKMWGGKFDELLLLGLPMAGQIPQGRMAGMLAAVRDLLPKFDDRRVISLNGHGQYERTLEVVRKHLRNSKPQRVLIGGINDPSTLGAFRAYEEAGRAANCLVVGQNASIEARREMRRPGSRFVGSVAYFPENYGQAVLEFAFDILRGIEVPPAMFVKHQLITAENVDEIYPNDALIPLDGSDLLLYSSR